MADQLVVIQNVQNAVLVGEDGNLPAAYPHTFFQEGILRVAISGIVVFILRPRVSLDILTRTLHTIQTQPDLNIDNLAKAAHLMNKGVKVPGMPGYPPDSMKPHPDLKPGEAHYPADVKFKAPPVAVEYDKMDPIELREEIGNVFIDLMKAKETDYRTICDRATEVSKLSALLASKTYKDT